MGRAILYIPRFASSFHSYRDPFRSLTFLAQRLTCKRFAKLGVNRQFARVSIRFSKAGFERLQWVAKQPHLATEVKKFSYIVPIFYPQGRARTMLTMIVHSDS